MKPDVIRISHLEESTTVLGPGSRYVIWTQGCEKKCKNCIYPEGQKPDGGRMADVRELIESIASKPKLTGVTISGGEPFLQFDALEALVKGIKEHTKCDIMLYSGYTLEEIRAKIGQERARRFFSYIDILIDGEYVDEQNNGSMYRGSDNQNIYFFTDKYAAFRDKIYHTKNRDIEFTLNNRNEVVMIGIPPKGFYREFIKKIGEEHK